MRFEPLPIRRTLKASLFAGLVIACATLAACDRPAQDIAKADAERGRLLLWQFGCGSCHRIGGVVGAVGEVGPPLDGVTARVYIAGVLANTPENLIRWIQSPQQIDPLTAMPDMGVSAEQARDMVAFLQSRR